MKINEMIATLEGITINHLSTTYSDAASNLLVVECYGDIDG